MKRKLIWFLLGACLTGILLVYGQVPDAGIIVSKPIQAKLAVPDLRGTGEAAQHMAVFNQTLWSDLDESSVFTMVAKSMYPLEVPQRPDDFKAPGAAPAGRKTPWLTDWSSPPANASHLAFGYVAVQENQLVLLGWLYDVTQPDTTNAQLLQKRYFGPVRLNDVVSVLEPVWTWSLRLPAVGDHPQLASAPASSAPDSRPLPGGQDARH